MEVERSPSGTWTGVEVVEEAIGGANEKFQPCHHHYMSDIESRGDPRKETRKSGADDNNDDCSTDPSEDEWDDDARERSGGGLLASMAESGASRDEIVDRIRLEFPEESVPSAGDLLKTLLERRSGRRRDGGGGDDDEYEPGDWVEVEGPDMTWRLEMLKSKKEVGGGGGSFRYDAGSERSLRAAELRASEEGLTILFGRRPWIWQQWALLKFENVVRFQRHHEHDFRRIDAGGYAAGLWSQWLDHPSNGDFRRIFYDRRVGDRARRKLVDHIMKPFCLIDDIGRGEGNWNFEEEGARGLSVFTYLGVLGSGYTIPLVVVGLQFVIPALLLYASLEENHAGGWDDLGGWCTSEGDMVNRLMILMVMILYLVKVVPESCISFYNTAGSANTPYSRLMSLRQEIWEQGDDQVGQMFGFKMDLYMNTAYVCCLYILNVFILFNLDDTMEVILNALAIEFICHFDEEFTNFSWWDPDKRWITAGAIELVIQKTLRLKWLCGPSRFCKNFDASLEKTLEACDGDRNLLRCSSVARKDSEDTSFMTADEVLYHRLSEAARSARNRNAMGEYCKPEVHFGALDRFLFRAFGAKNAAVFNRYGDYRCWRRWEAVLYLGRIPNLDEVFDAGDEASLSRAVADRKPTSSSPFANYDAVVGATSPKKAFLISVLDIMTLRKMIRGLYFSITHEKYMSFFFRLFDGVTEWLVYAVQLAFPPIILLALFAVPYCY